MKRKISLIPFTLHQRWMSCGFGIDDLGIKSLIGLKWMSQEWKQKMILLITWILEKWNKDIT